MVNEKQMSMLDRKEERELQYHKQMMVQRTEYHGLMIREKELAIREKELDIRIREAQLELLKKQIEKE